MHKVKQKANQLIKEIICIFMGQTIYHAQKISRLPLKQNFTNHTVR